MPKPNKRQSYQNQDHPAQSSQDTPPVFEHSEDDDDSFLNAEIVTSDSDSEFEQNDSFDSAVLSDSDSDSLPTDHDNFIDQTVHIDETSIVPSDNNGIPWGGSLSDDEKYNNVKPRLIRPAIVPETDSDDSDLEEHANTVGNIPMEWYDDYPHIGYDLDGKKILKPATSDELDHFLAKMDDPKYWTSIHDKVDQKNIQLTEEELEIVSKLQKADYAAEGFDPYQPTVEWFTSQTLVTPVTGKPEPKRRFVPSKWEHKKVVKVVRAIRNGWIVPRKPKKVVQAYDIWGPQLENEDIELLRKSHPMYMPAPKRQLPGHIQSYNPPAEYLFTDQERQAWDNTEPEDREIDFVPEKFNSLRQVPGYSKLVKDHFERCLDLYLCPRVRKTKVDVDPESLIPKLPDPKDLEPFPTSLSLIFRGHDTRVRSISISPSGQFLLSGSDDGIVRLWEIASTRCLHSWTFEHDGISRVAWNPSKGLSMAAISSGPNVYLVHLPSVAEGIVADVKIAQQTLTLLQGEVGDTVKNNTASGQPQAPCCEWRKPTRKLALQGVMWTLHHQRDVVSVAWHRKGDYFVTGMYNAGASSVQIHQLSRKQTQQPFTKNKGLVVSVVFHPTRPHLFLATQRYVRIYDLQSQVLVKKLRSGCKWISSMDIHPNGENLIVGSYDKRFCWFDLELGVMPYKTLRYHKQAVRSVVFHPKYPLFASCSDDGTIHVFHGMVYSDLVTNPLIVPVKILRAHRPVQSLGALHIQWHPTQPWIISSGADGDIKLWT